MGWQNALITYACPFLVVARQELRMLHLQHLSLTVYLGTWQIAATFRVNRWILDQTT